MQLGKDLLVVKDNLADDLWRLKEHLLDDLTFEWHSLCFRALNETKRQLIRLNTKAGAAEYRRMRRRTGVKPPSTLTVDPATEEIWR